MITLVEKHFDKVATQFVDVRGLVLDVEPRLGGLRAGRDAATVGLDRANPAAALMPQPFVVAKARHVDAGLVGRVHDRLALFGRNLDPVDREGEIFHSPKSLSKM